MSIFSKSNKPLELALSTLDSTKKPQLDSQKMNDLAAHVQQDPTAFLLAFEKHLMAFNRYKLSSKQRFDELFHMMEEIYPNLCFVKNKFLERHIPETTTRRNATQAAYNTTVQLIMGYKHVLQLDYDSPSSINKKAWLQRLTSTGMYLLELIHLAQIFLAMRYQRLPTSLWLDVNQILFAIQRHIDITQSHLRLHDTFAESTDSLCKTNTPQHVYILIHLFDIASINNWPCQYMGILDRYLDRQQPPLTLTENDSATLANNTYICSEGFGHSAVQQETETTDDTALLDVSSLLKNIVKDKALIENTPEDRKLKISLLAHLNPKYALSLLSHLSSQIGKHERGYERSYLGKQPITRVASGWEDCYQQLQVDISEVSTPAPLLDQQDLAADEWSIIDDSKSGSRLFTRETNSTIQLEVGQLLSYVCETTTSAQVQLAKIERIQRITEFDIEIGLSKIIGSVAATTIQGLNGREEETCDAILCYGDQPVLLTAPESEFRVGMTSLTVLHNQESEAFNIHKIEMSSPTFQILHIDLDFPPPSTTSTRSTSSTSSATSQQPTLSNDPSDLTIGDTLLNTYKVTGLLGEGGMGKVYKIFHHGWNTELAVKTAKPDALEKAGGIDSFEKEAETWVNLGLHQHIVCCYYIRRLDQIPLLFAEYVDGGSLDQWISEKRLTTLEQILDIAIQFARGLEHSHKNNLIHRDVKPANVMMTKQGIAKVTDFGLALTSSKSGSKGSAAMTVVYCSPEQANQEPLTTKTDMWSWGLSILVMFKGEVTWPFGAMAPAVLEGYLESEAEERKELPHMPDKLAKLLKQCFQQEVKDRPKDMKIVADVVCQIYQEVVGTPYSRSLPSMNLDTPDNLNNRAVSLLDLDKRKEAFKLWQTALQKQPNHLESLYNIGLLRWRQGQLTDDALLMKLKGSQTSGGGRWVQSYLQGVIHLERDDCNSAESLWETMTPDASMRPEVQLATSYTAQRLMHGNYRKLQQTFPTEHLGEITSIDSSKGARVIISASRDGHIKLWNAEAKTQADHFLHQGKAVLSVRISRNSRFVISGGSDDNARQWDIKTGNILHSTTHQHHVNCVRLSTNDKLALSAGANSINIWQTDNYKVVAQLDKHKARVLAADFTQNNRFIASGDLDGQLYLWELASGRLLRRIEAHKKALTALIWLPNNQNVITASVDTTIKLWDLKAGKCLHTYQGHSREINALRLSHDGQILISASTDKTMRVWHIRNKQCIRTFESEEKLNTLCWSHNQDNIYTGGSQWIIKHWQILPQNKVFHAPMMLTQVVNSEVSLAALNHYEQALSKAQEALSVGRTVEALQHVSTARAQPGYGRSLDALKVWQGLYLRFPFMDLNNAWQGIAFQSDETITTFCLSWKARYIVVGTEFGSLKIWDIVKEECIKTLPAHQGRVNCVHLSADNRYILSGGRDHHIKLWDLRKANLVHDFTEHDGPITELRFFNNEDFFMSSSEDKTLKLWHIPQKRCVQVYAGHYNFVNTLDLSSDNEFMLSAAGGLSSQIDNTAKLWQVSTGRCLQTLRGHDNWISVIKMSPDGQRAITASQDRTIRIWKISTAKCLHTITGHDGPITSIDISPNGRFILSASKDKTVKLWLMDNAENVHTFRGHEAGVIGAYFSVDGRYIISAGEDNKIQLWVLDWSLQERTMEGWDWQAKPWLESFMNQQMPYTKTLTPQIDPKFSDMSPYLSRSGLPTWNDNDLSKLYYQLGCAGLGWLKPSGILQQLDTMLEEWKGTVSLVKEAFPCPHCHAVYQRRPRCQSCGQDIVSPDD